MFRAAFGPCRRSQLGRASVRFARRSFATEAEATKPNNLVSDDDPRFVKFLAGVVGLCIVQRVIMSAPKVSEASHPSKTKPADDHSFADVPESTPATLDEPPAAPPVAAAPPITPTMPTTPAATATPAAIPAAATAAPAVTAAPAAPVLPGSKGLGISAGWSISEKDGGAFAISMLESRAPLQLTPPGTKVGAVLVGDGEVLLELPEAFGIDAPTLYRVRLPAADSPADEEVSIDPQPDTISPAGVATPPGSVVAWITTGSPMAVRGALVQTGDGLSLALRTQDVARVGNPLWLETCKRLGLPPPPPDPTASSPIFSEWRCAAAFSDEVHAHRITALRFPRR